MRKRNHDDDHVVRCYRFLQQSTTQLQNDARLPNGRHHYSNSDGEIFYFMFRVFHAL